MNINNEINATFEKLLNTLPVRARVAFALAASERGLNVLSSKPTLTSVAMASIDEVWKWIVNPSIRASQIYEWIGSIEMRASEWGVDEQKERAVVNAVGMAIYYATWHAKCWGDDDSVLSSAMYDVTESDLLEILQSACEAGIESKELAWQRKALDQLVADFGTSDPTSLGPTIDRDYFARIE